MNKIGRWSAALVAAGALSLGAVPVPDGFWQERVDHIQTPSESLYFTYRFEPGDEKALGRGVEFIVTDLMNKEIASGESADFEAAGEKLAAFRLLSPERMAGLKTGWYELAIRPKPEKGTSPEFYSMKFFVRNDGFARRAVYLLDNVTPEGFAFWCSEGNAPLVEPLRSFPEQGKPDCVVVSSYRPLPEKTFRELEKFVADGGTALFFGVNNAQLDRLNPLVQKRDDLYPKTSRALPDGRKVAAVNAELAKDASLREAFSDGSPLIAEKKYGRGRVIGCAAPIKPGREYRDMLYRNGLGIKVEDAAKRSPVAAADADGWREGISRNNFGRFGWLNSDRVNALSIRPEQTFRMWDVEQDYFGVSFTGAHNPGKLSAFSTNWLGKTLIGTGGCWGMGTEIIWGLGTPGVLFRNADMKSVSIESPMLGMLAFPVKGGTRTVKLEPGKPVDLSGLDSNWVLFWKKTEKFDAWPLLAVFNRKISSARMEGARLAIEFAAPGIDLAVMPLAGVRHYTQEDVSAWSKALPEDVAERCARWSRVQGARTVGCVERYKVDKEAGTAAIRNDFEYLTIPNDWGVEPEFVAPIPPLLPLYAATGFAKLGDSADLDYATLHGPLWGTPGKSAEYTLSIPDLNYTMPEKAADPHLELAANRALFERMCEHLAVPGLVYIGPGYSIVERQKERIYPVRDLEEACSKSGLEAAEWKFIDLHRTLGGVAGNLMFKPYLDGVKGYDSTRDRLNTKIHRNVNRDIGFFQYKTFLRYRTEPNTGARYLAAFMAPVRQDAGYRIFHDMNETIGIFLMTLGLYDRMIGDPEFFKENEPYIDLFMSNYLVSNDWAWMSSAAVEWGMGNNIDMLNAEIAGWAGMVRIKETLGRDDEADFGRYMAAKAGASTGARLLFAEFYNSLNFPVPPQLAPVIHEMADVEQARQVRNAYLPYGVSQGYGEGWPSLWPNALSKGMLTHYIDGKDFYSTSKGVPVELLNFYRSSEVLAVPLRGYEAAFRDAAYKAKAPYLYSRIAGNSYLKNSDRADLERMLYRTFSMPNCSAEALGAGAADWESTAMMIMLGELCRTASQDTSSGTVPVADEKSGKIQWEAVEGKKGAAPVKIRQVRSDDEPENVIDGSVSTAFEFPTPAGGNVPVAFTRFDAKSVVDKNCSALSFQVKAETPGTLDLVLPDREWKQRGAASVALTPDGKFHRVRLEFGRDFGMKPGAMTPEALRGELFFYNGLLPGAEHPELRFYIDDIRFEP